MGIMHAINVLLDEPLIFVVVNTLENILIRIFLFFKLCRTFLGKSIICVKQHDVRYERSNIESSFNRRVVYESKSLA